MDAWTEPSRLDGGLYSVGELLCHLLAHSDRRRIRIHEQGSAVRPHQARNPGSPAANRLRKAMSTADTGRYLQN